MNDAGAARPRILMVFTGGTISMRVVPGRGAIPARSGAEILALVPDAARHADTQVEDFDRLPGPHWTPERMLDLARCLDLRLATGRYDGAVVTHGTDTLEETSYFLDLVLRTDLPVIVTGAMRTPDEPTWDGSANLVHAIRCAGSPAARGLGVLVVLDEVVHAAREVVKTHTESLGAFASPRGGELGVVDVDAVHMRRAPGLRERVPIERVESRVDLVAATLGADGRLLRCSVESGARGIVLQGMGRGNVPPAFLSEARAAIARGIPVVVASRCTAGRTAAVYGYEGGGFTLREAGAIFAGDLAPSKARIKLMVLLGAGRDAAAIREAFEATD